MHAKEKAKRRGKNDKVVKNHLIKTKNKLFGEFNTMENNYGAEGDGYNFNEG